MVVVAVITIGASTAPTPAFIAPTKVYLGPAFGAFITVVRGRAVLRASPFKMLNFPLKIIDLTPSTT